MTTAIRTKTNPLLSLKPMRCELISKATKFAVAHMFLDLRPLISNFTYKNGYMIMAICHSIHLISY
jgi:hypothetical protein